MKILLYACYICIEYCMCIRYTCNRSNLMYVNTIQVNFRIQSFMNTDAKTSTKTLEKIYQKNNIL